MQRSGGEKLQFATGILTSLTALLLAVSQFVGQIKEVLKLRSIPAPLLWMAIIVCGLVAIAVFRNVLATRSRLVYPDALVLRADDAQHLYGRQEDIENIVNLCSEHPQVNLDGESGAGKTALLRSGVIPVLRDAGVY